MQQDFGLVVYELRLEAVEMVFDALGREEGGCPPAGRLGRGAFFQFLVEAHRGAVGHGCYGLVAVDEGCDDGEDFEVVGFAFVGEVRGCGGAHVWSAEVVGDGVGEAEEEGEVAVADDEVGPDAHLAFVVTCVFVGLVGEFMETEELGKARARW